MLTTDKNDPDLHKKRPDGQNEKYLILSEEERAKGFVRPLRRAYIHVGQKNPRVCKKPAEHYPNGIDENGDKWICALHDKENDKCTGWGMEKNMDKKGCGFETKMGLALCETYARDPKFYGSTFCSICGSHFPVQYFVWAEDGEVVGS